MARSPAACLILVVCALAPAQQDFEKKKARLTGPLVEDLAELALWCRDKELRHARHDLCRIVIGYDPDHAICREELGYVRAPDGKWKQDYKRIPPAFEPSRHDEELFRRRLKIIRPFKKGLLTLIQRDRKLDPGARRKELEALARIDDGASWIVPALEQVRLGGRKVLPETAVSEHRGEILRLLGEAMVATAEDPIEAKPGSDEDFGFKWRSGAICREVKVFSTGPANEASRAARTCLGAGNLFRFLTGTRKPQRDGFELWLLARQSEKDAVINTHPLMTSELRVTAMPNPGFWLGQLAVEFGRAPEMRLDGAVRQTLGLYCADHWAIGHPQGWAYEGFGVYFTWLVTGTRYRWLIAPGGGPGDDSTTRDRLKRSSSRWFASIQKTYTSGRYTTAGSLMSLDVKSMTPDHVLQAYAMAAYFVECFPTLFADILADSGKNVPVRDLLSNRLGFTIDQFEKRFVRWVREQPKKRG